MCVFAGVNNNTLAGLSADYVWNKLNVVAAYQQIKSLDIAGTGTSGTSSIAGGKAQSFGSDMIDNQTYAAATYDFGILKGYGQYVTRRATSTLDSTQSTSRTAYQVGVRSQLTSVISAYATMGLGKSSYFGSNLGYNNFRTFQIGSDYALSKRTNLYAIYGQYSQSSSGATPNSVIGNSASMTALSASTVGTNGNNYAVGIRHTF